MCPCECVYLQSISCNVDVSHHAGHLFPFENFGWILDADDEQDTHYWIIKSQLFVSGRDDDRENHLHACVNVCVSVVSVCLSNPARSRSSRSAMSFGLTMCGGLTFEPPSLHNALKTLSNTKQTEENSIFR